MDQSPTPSPIAFTPSLDQRTTYMNALIWFASAMTLCSVMLMTIFFSFWKRSGQFTTPPENQPSGLDRTVLNSIPVFVYSYPADDDARLDCSVCLGEFKEREKGRSLPGCGHSFHVECVDMWFRSHSTCPLCRSNVGVGHWNDGLKQGTDLA